jgi:hypothetical protein
MGRRGLQWEEVSESGIMKSYIICTLHQMLGWSNEEGCYGQDMLRAWGRWEMRTKSWLLNLEGRDLSLNSRIILKWILGTSGWRVWIEFIWLTVGNGGGLLLTHYWTFCFRKRWGISWVAECAVHIVMKDTALGSQKRAALASAGAWNFFISWIVINRRMEGQQLVNWCEAHSSFLRRWFRSQRVNQEHWFFFQFMECNHVVPIKISYAASYNIFCT